MTASRYQVGSPEVSISVVSSASLGKGAFMCLLDVVVEIALVAHAATDQQYVGRDAVGLQHDVGALAGPGEALVAQQVMHLEGLVVRHADVVGLEREVAGLGVARIEV